jgi:hypothetical protein
MTENALSQEQMAHYLEQGYVVAKGLLSDREIDRLDQSVLSAFRDHRYDPKECKNLRYPEVGLYALNGNSMADPDLAFVAEHPAIVAGVEALIGGPICLTAYVAYLRTPGATGTAGDYRGGHSAHCDYKPYRPVGSSLDWLFVIIPLMDYDEAAGPLYVSPGSHRLTRILADDKGEGVRQVEPADPSQLSPLVNPNLMRGDVLFMHMFCWHEATGNQSDHDRYGMYNKYAACSAPAGSGPFLYSEAAYNALSDSGKHLLKYHSDKPLATTRLLAEQDGRFFLVADAQEKWSFPGGLTGQGEAYPGWDVGNEVSSLQSHVRDQFGLDLNWMTYVGDYPEGEALCRVYARRLTSEGGTLTGNGMPGRWFTREEIADLAASDRLSGGFEARAIEAWLDPEVLRGVGESYTGAAGRGKYGGDAK